MSDTDLRDLVIRRMFGWAEWVEPDDPDVLDTADAVVAQVRAQIAKDIETRVPAGHPVPGYLDGLRYAAQIARGES